MTVTKTMHLTTYNMLKKVCEEANIEIIDGADIPNNNIIYNPILKVVFVGSCLTERNVDILASMLYI